MSLPEQMRERVKRCHSHTTQYEEEENYFLNMIFTCDITWVHFMNLKILSQVSLGNILNLRRT